MPPTGNSGSTSNFNAGIQTFNLQEDQTGNYQGVIITVREITEDGQAIVRLEKGIAQGQNTLTLGQTLRGISIGDSNIGFTNLAIKLVSIDISSGTKTAVLEVGSNELL